MKFQTVQFGIIADVQYADKPDAEGRFYRASINSLEDAVACFNGADLHFVIQLGDLIDGGDNALIDLSYAVEVFDRLRTRTCHVLGNHDVAGLDRATVLRLLNMEQAFYAFDIGSVRFVVLDTLDYSLQGGWHPESPNYRRGLRLLEQVRQRNSDNAQEYNGAVGPEQLQWLDEMLAQADARGMQTILFSHLPLRPLGEKHTAWNAEEVIAVLEKHPSVKAVFSGHNHTGGYTQQNGIHYVTCEAAVNAPSGAWAVVTLSADAIQIAGSGSLTSRTLRID
jgi:3',5'-cyclic AMP phosphodiesterase CpdA